ncbi:hypothetical protein BdWA1_002857 [Babesia duncani]|uniref:Uncharacterized protein n=1 Tax=Babesia duncani TaxID=323732 RepID=A0AAD9PI87_9APIC|nr:hypothetical protein BdWA1_002857 [Babesia duncani]
MLFLHSLIPICTYEAVSGCFLNAIGPSFLADSFIGGSVQSVRVLVGTQNVNGTSFRQVEFCIQELKEGLNILFKDRLLSLDSVSDCKLKVSLHAKINLVGSRFSEPDTTKDNGDPDKNGSDSDINEAYQKMLDDLVNFSSNDSGKMSTMNLKRKNIIDAIKEVCKDCCCRMTEPYCVQAESVASAIKQLCTKCCTKKRENNGDETCIDVNQIITAVGKLCVNCHCKDTNRSSQWNEVEKEIDDFYCCHVSEIKEKLASCKCSGCSTCSNSDCCFDKEKLIEEIKELCCCDKVKNALQSCSSCSASGSGCQCCQEAKKQLESCQCRFCTAKKEIEQLAGSSAQCCSDPGCSCSTNGGNCVKKAEIEQKLNGLCQCKKDLDSIKSKIDEVSKKCNENKCCNPDTIKDQIKEICKTCECRNSDCCNEDQIKKRAQKVIESSCKCRTNKCCFRDVNTGDLSSHSKEQAKLKNIAKNIFKYFRPPIAYETGVMTLSSETKELCISSSGGDKITVDAKNKNVLKIPKQAFQSLMASAKMHENKVKDFHPNSMMSIKFHGITLTFCTLSGEGFCIDGFPINGGFSMNMQYAPAGIFTRKTALWRNIVGDNGSKKHDLSFGDLNGNPRIDPSKCSCSILSDPLFGTVFGAICISISIVQFIIALFVSQGYYDGFQSYMDAVRSGFSWPTQYDNVVNSVFWVLVGTQNVNGTSFRQVEFCIQELKEGLNILFKDRLLSLDSVSDCKLKVSLLAKINLVGVKWAQPDVSKENGDPGKGDSDPEITTINSAYNTMLDELISPDANSDSSKKSILDGKRKKIIDAIKDVCQDCCCNRKEDEYCIQPTDIVEQIKQVCASCCCKNKDPCVDSSKIMEHVNKLCQNCCCKQKDCCNTEGVLSQIGEFCVCLIKDAKGRLDDCTCSGCSTCKENCIDKQKLMKEILKLCSCDKAKKELEQAAQKCSGCSSGTCQCCQEIQKKFKDCSCMACDLKRVIDGLQGSGENGSNCCNSSSCSCSSDSNSNCRKRTDVLDALNAYCKCETDRNKIKEKIEKLCQSCKSKKCCKTETIESQIKELCNSCPCKKDPKCCNESEIKSKVQQVIEKHCTCKKFKCCFNGVQNGDLSSHSAEKEKLKNIALAIFKYFRPPIAHSTGVMTLKSTTETELEFSSGSSSGDDKITVDSSKNVLKIPKQAFKSLMASSQIPQVKVTTFHKNTMLSIHFEEISLTFQKLNGTGFEIDGYPINGTFLMQLGYQPIGPFTKNSANMRKKTENEPKKHNLSWSIDNHYPQIDKNKCSCSILSNPLFGTVFGAICLTISIVQFIIALFVSQGYYDGFQSYMDAVRSGFSWPTQYDNVASSIFWVLVASSGNHRNVDFCIQELHKDLLITFENRVLSLDSNVSCKLKVGLHAKITLVGVKWAQPDVSKENGDPENGSDTSSGNKAIKEAYNTMLDELISPDANSDSSKKSILDGKRKKIIDAINKVCEDCCCNRKEDDFCIKPSDISQAVKEVCASCCCKSKDPCVDSSKIMEHVNKLCQNCCCKKKDCCNTNEVLSQIGEFCVCLIKDAKEKLENCTCDSCSSCQENCIDKQKLMKEIEQLCSCSEAKKVVEEAPQKCDSCKGSGSCKCCQEAKKQFESCPCMACDLQQVIDEIKQDDGSNKCSDPNCPCSSDSDSKCRTKDAVLKALNAYCKCKDQVKQIKEKIEKLCESCKSKKCCDSSLIQNDIQKICNSCPCKTHPKCCNESEINKKVQQVIESKCTCKKFKCCFNGIKDANQSLNTDEQGKLKKIALAIFKYFRPPIAHSTGVMTLKSTADIDLQFSSGSSNEKITVDAKNKNVLKIPKQAFKDLMASFQIPQVKVTTFHKNTMLSIHFEEISLTFQKLNGTGFEIDGYPINGTFLMQLGYQPIGPYTKNSANWRNKNSEGTKHDLSWDISSNHPQIDKNKCSCSILSDPLFGTVFGAICLTISIVQFIIALFVSQGYYDGFRSYMDAVRSGFSWPTQYDNVVSSMFWWFGLGVRNGSRLLLGSSPKIHIKMEAKIVLYGVRKPEPDVGKENGEPSKSNEEVDSAYEPILKELISPSPNNKPVNSNPSSAHKTTMDQKRLKIIEAIKKVCEKCCCNRKADEYCIQPSDISKAVQSVCASCCCKNEEPCVKYEDIIEKVNQLCVDCCCKKDDGFISKDIELQAKTYCVCPINKIREQGTELQLCRENNCACHNSDITKSKCCNKGMTIAGINYLCPFEGVRALVENCPGKDHSTGKGCCGTQNACKCCKQVKEKIRDCKCKYCEVRETVKEFFQEEPNNQGNKCQDCSGHNCYQWPLLLTQLQIYCDCRKGTDNCLDLIRANCNQNNCCDVKTIEKDIQDICKNCDCKQKNCCNETQINEKVQQVIKEKCTCKKKVCCFNKVNTGDLTDSNKHSAEQEKLKNIAKAIFKYFMPPRPHSTGLMSLKSTADFELKLCSSTSSQTDICISGDTIRMPKKALKKLIASTQIGWATINYFHPNSWTSIKFEEIILSFPKLCNEGFKVDGFPTHQSFSMKIQYGPAGIFTRPTANWRKKNSNKHDLTFGDLSEPKIIAEKCSCSILSDPLFGTVFGAICLTISIVQFIIALFISQGYYDGFQSYMDAVRSGFSWPTQYDNVVSSIFWWLWIGVRNGSRLLLGTYAAVRVLVASSGSSRQVEFCIEQLKEDLSVTFENRVLSLDSGSDCKLKVSLHAKINLVGVKWAQPDVSKENGDPEKGDSDPEITVINSAYNTMLDELISPDANSDSSKKSILDGKRKKIIDAIKDVCQDCCCNRKEDEYCIQPTDIVEQIKQVCASCCCKNEGPCVDSSKIMEHVNKLCQNCCCKKEDCCGTEGVLSQIEDFCVCLIKDAKEKLENCTCDSCSSCQENCIDKQKLMTEIEQLCSCSEAKKVVEQAAQKCDSCKGSGSCKCCQEAKKQFESCPCMACDLKTAIDEIKGSGENGSNCCDSSSCPCSNSNCRKKTDVLDALNTYCRCTTQRKEIKEKIEKLCKECKDKKCCDVSEIQSDIQNICNSCPCKKDPKCCNESEIKSKVQQVIEKHCTCKKFKCCFNGVQNGDLSSHSAEKEKLKNIALAIFKYFRPPIAHSTGVMTLKSTTETELEFSSGSSSGDDKITVDSSKNVLKIPKQAFKDLIASTKINQVKVTTFHKNTMLSIHFEEISLTFQKLNGTGFEIDGYPINGTFLMQLGYQPIGPFTKNSANMRKKVGKDSNEKHNLSWGISSNHPRIDPSKCSCSILSNPLFGTVFGAICLTISIVQFIIALFVSQGYYDGFRSYMDAVRSGFSWPTQYDNVVSSMFWWFGLGVRNGSRLLLGLYKTDILAVVC